MPNYTFICLECKTELVENVPYDERDKGPGYACAGCGHTNWSHRHCEGANFDSHFGGSHRLEYNKYGRRKNI